MNTKLTLRENREHRESGGDFHLKVNDKYVALLNSLPQFQDLSTTQLLHLLPKRYRRFIPQEDQMARAAIIGMLAPESLIQAHIGFRYLERSVVVQSR
jgi:hypothetical protein